jgi:hypothetical protein
MPVQPTEPVTDLDWATNANYAGGTDVGTATKSEPAAGRKADGWRGNVGGDKPPAQEFNWWQHWAAKWLGWLFDVLTVGHDDNGDHRANVIDTLQIVDLAVETAKIDNLAVTTGKINTDAVTNAKMANDSVDTPEIVDEAVIRNHILEESSNLVINPDAHMGDDFWWDGGDPVTNYTTPGTDVDQAAASYTDPNFNATSRNSDFAIGTYFSIAPVPASKDVMLSEKIDLQQNQDITLSFLNNIVIHVAGTMNVDVVCYDATGKYQGIICPISTSGSEASWVLYTATGTTLANGVGGATADTDYIRVRVWIDNAADATLWRLTRIKVNRGALANSFSDEASQGQNLAARYSRNTTQTVADASIDVINFDDKTFDDPGADRVTTGANWVFTADRYMKVELSASVQVQTTADEWDLGESVELWLYKDTGGGAAAYSLLDLKIAEANVTGVTMLINLSGTDGIELNEGDTIDVRLENQTGANVNTTAVATNNYIFIREIN